MTILLGTLIIWALQFSGCPCFSYICLRQYKPYPIPPFDDQSYMLDTGIPPVRISMDWFTESIYGKPGFLLKIQQSLPIFRFSLEGIPRGLTLCHGQVTWSSWLRDLYGHPTNGIWTHHWNSSLMSWGFPGATHNYTPKIIHISPELIIIYIVIISLDVHTSCEAG